MPRFDDDDMMFDDDEGSIIDDEEVDIENRFYDAKCEMEENLESAIEQFKSIVEDDAEKQTEWGYKSIRKLCLHYAKTGNKEGFLEYFEKYLEYVSVPSVSKIEKSVFLILNEINSLGNEFVTETTNRVIEGLNTSTNFSRIVFKLKIKQAQTMFENKQYEELQPCLNELISSCFLENGKEDPMRSHLLIDLYAIQVQLYHSQNDMRKLQQLFSRIDFTERNISNPKLNGNVLQISGKIKVINGDYVKAKTELFQSFYSLNDCGVEEAKESFKYLVLAVLLSGSSVNIFADPSVRTQSETEHGKQLERIFTAFHSYNIPLFKKTLEETKDVFMNDSFVSQFIDQVVLFAQKRALLRMVECFRSIKLSFLAEKLSMTESEVESLALKSIFDGSLRAKINQFKRHLVVTEDQSIVTRKYLAITDMSKQLFSSLQL